MTNRVITAITDFIFVADEPKNSDAMFILGGSFPELPEYAAELYHMGLAPVLVPSGAILEEDKSGFTKENATFSRKVCDENGLSIKRAIIVCKSFHARRCQMMYQLAFPDTELLVCPIDCFDITRENWHTFEYGIDRVLGELSRCGNQMNEEIKRWIL